MEGASWVHLLPPRHKQQSLGKAELTFLFVNRAGAVPRLEGVPAPARSASAAARKHGHPLNHSTARSLLFAFSSTGHFHFFGLEMCTIAEQKRS